MSKSLIFLKTCSHTMCIIYHPFYGFQRNEFAKIEVFFLISFVTIIWLGYHGNMNSHLKRTFGRKYVWKFKFYDKWFWINGWLPYAVNRKIWVLNFCSFFLQFIPVSRYVHSVRIDWVFIWMHISLLLMINNYIKLAMCCGNDILQKGGHTCNIFTCYRFTVCRITYTTGVLIKLSRFEHAQCLVSVGGTWCDKTRYSVFHEHFLYISFNEVWFIVNSRF